MWPPRKSKYKDDIIRLKKEGKKCEEIKESLGCSYHTIYKFLNKEGLVDKATRKVRRSVTKTLSIEKDRARGRFYQERNRKIIKDFLSDKSCVDCGNNDIRVLDFDHVRGKKIGPIANAISHSWPVKRLLEEMPKCEIRCSNCHRIVTYERRAERNQIKTNN